MWTICGNYRKCCFQAEDLHLCEWVICCFQCWGHPCSMLFGLCCSLPGASPHQNKQEKMWTDGQMWYGIPISCGRSMLIARIVPPLVDPDFWNADTSILGSVSGWFWSCSPFPGAVVRLDGNHFVVSPWIIWAKDLIGYSRPIPYKWHCKISSDLAGHVVSTIGCHPGWQMPCRPGLAVFPSDGQACWERPAVVVSWKSPVHGGVPDFQTTPILRSVYIYI